MDGWQKKKREEKKLKLKMSGWGNGQVISKSSVTIESWNDEDNYEKMRRSKRRMEWMESC